MSKTALGLDIGSRSIEAVWLDEQGCIITYKIADSTHDPIAVARELIAHDDYDVMCATGYGRHTARDAFDCNIITEIKAYAVGAHSVFPEARSILDIGGQDTKVISLDENGRIVDFEMNDKCAAGTGKFLEVMARALGYSLEEFVGAAESSEQSVTISSMCTVFAESEVTGLVHRGENRPAIARGLVESISKRVITSLRRVGATPPLAFAGGVAKNSALASLISHKFNSEILIAEEPQIVGALGAALCALHES